MLFPTGDRLLSYSSLEVSGTTLSSKRIISLSFSESHAVAVLSDGESLAIGSNWHGKLGIDNARDANVLTLVRSPARITSAFAGQDFTLFLTDANLVLSAGLAKSLQPVSTGIQALKLAGCRSTVAVVLPDGGLQLWPDFRDSKRFVSPALLARPQGLSCGVGFAAVLLENQLLVRADSDGSSRILSAARACAKFNAISASDTYIAAVDESGAGWIFGDFNGYPARRLSAEPVFAWVLDVFAFPHYAIGIGPGFEPVGIGKIPPEDGEGEAVFAPLAKPVLPGLLSAYFAGNDREFVALPLYISRETALKIGDGFIPEIIGDGLAIE